MNSKRYNLLENVDKNIKAMCLKIKAILSKEYICQKTKNGQLF